MTTKNCVVCEKTQVEINRPLQRCSRCKTRLYCSPECQTSDWPLHKPNCRAPAPWYDSSDYRLCDDRSLHEGNLELITWDSPRDETGWGHVFLDEADDMKRKFEVEFEGSEKKLYEYWPQAFRWTCCGTDASMTYGCDHHGRGRNPCTCDFCRMGQPLPDNIYLKESAPRMGLHLPRGPDVRSFHASAGITAGTVRSALGLDD